MLYQYLSSENPTDISFAISSRLFGSTVLIFFDSLDDDSFLVELFWCFDPPCMVEEIGGPYCLGSNEEDRGAVIIREGCTCTTFNGLGVVAFGVFLLVLLDEEVAFGVVMVKKKVVFEEDE